MVVGQSRYFSLDAPVGLDITEYTAKWELVKNGAIIKSGDAVNNNTKFDIQFQTAGLTDGNYEVRVFVTDPVDGFIQGVVDKFTLE